MRLCVYVLQCVAVCCSLLHFGEDKKKLGEGERESSSWHHELTSIHNVQYTMTIALTFENFVRGKGQRRVG